MTRQTHIAHPGKLFIGGSWVDPSSDAMIDVIDSGTGELFLRVAEAREPDIARAVAAAREAFDAGPWPRMSAGERAAYLGAMAAALNETVEDGAVFGPVLCVIPAKDEAHAIRLANETSFGLNASVFTNDIERAYQVARALRSGTVRHNAMRSDLTIGFGGFKQSGVGREGGGLDALLPFLERKTMLLEAYPRHLDG